MVVGLLGTLIGLLVGFVVGGLALFVAAELVQGSGRGFEYGLKTAAIGALAWFLLAWVPVVGVLLALAGWITVVNWRYPGDWRDAVVVAVVAWVVALVVLTVLELLGLGGLGVVGIPFV